VLVTLLLVSAGCKRNKTANQQQGGGGTTAADGTGSAGDARTYLEKGKQLYLDNEDEQAAEAFLQAIKADPNLAEAHFRLGLAYDTLQKAEEAEASYKKAVELYKAHLTEDPKDAEAHYNLGQTYAALHLYSEAVREYRQATRLKEDDADVYCDLGMALTRLAQYDEAAGAFSKSLEIDPNNYRAQDGLDEAKEGVSRMKSARKHAEDLLKKQKEDETKKQQSGSTAGAGKTP
jgi:tetratricopeptide (TPR) repeat protein